MLDQHEVIYADDAATESFHADDVGISAVSDQSREEMFGIFPELRANSSAYGESDHYVKISLQGVRHLSTTFGTLAPIAAKGFFVRP